jgi:hypothetical protein
MLLSGGANLTACDCKGRTLPMRALTPDIRFSSHRLRRDDPDFIRDSACSIYLADILDAIIGNTESKSLRGERE